MSDLANQDRRWFLTLWKIPEPDRTASYEVFRCVVETDTPP